MAAISGISTQSTGTTIDVNSIVSQLMQIEQQPLARLDQREASYQTQLSAYGSLGSAITTFQSALTGIANPAKFLSMKATASDTSILTASASSDATAGNHSISVTKLAQQQKLVALGRTSLTDPIGDGTSTTVSFDFGTISGGSLDVNGYHVNSHFASAGGTIKTVTIDSSNNSLSGIRDAINAAKVGVTATIVNDGQTEPYRLVLTTDASGSASSMKISVAGNSNVADLLANDPESAPPGIQNLSETQSAQNAELEVDGIAVTKASNTLTDVISGVTLTLTKETAGSPISLAISRDTSGAQSAVQGFIDGYNSISKTLKSLTGYDSTTKIAGPLQTDSIARGVIDSIRSVLSGTLSGAGTYSNLTQVGVSFQKDGTLALDSTKLQTALTSSPSDVASVFAQVGRTTDSLISYSGATAKTKAGSYAISVSRLGTQGTSAGSAAPNLTITASSNETLQVSLDGATATVTLTAGDYASAEALAQEVQSQINAAAAFVAKGSTVTACVSSGKITLTSDRYGSTSIISITGGNGANDLLGVAPVSTAGVDVAGSIGGVAASGNGQTLTGAIGSDAEGLSLTVAGGPIGSRGTVSFPRGYGYLLDQVLHRYVDAFGLISNRTDGINSSITDIGRKRESLNARLAVIEQRYRTQFLALDTMLSSMNTTQNFLSQQLNNLPGFYAKSSNG